MNKQVNQRRKEQQKFLDHLNMLDLEMVNSIVYDKIRQTRLGLLESLLEKGHGGGNWRRLIIQKLELIKEEA